MNTKRVAAFFLIAGSLLVIDWILGVLIVQRTLPNWVYLLANLPFGVVYVWTESQWVVNHYQILGRSVNDLWIALAQFSAVGAQALVYLGIWELLKRKRLSVQSNPDQL